MAVPVWPAGVPHESDADAASASASFRPPLISETEGGTQIMRPRPGPRATEFGWRSVHLTEVQWAALDQFLRVDLHEGTLVFDMPVFRPGSGFVTRKCQIKSGVVSTDFSVVPWVRVSFTLIVYNW